MGSPRIKGTGLRLEIDGTDYWADCTSVVLDQDPAVVLKDAWGSTVDTWGGWYFAVTAVQSTDPTSLWSLLWTHEHKSACVTYAPHGNPTPTADQPHFTAAVVLGKAPTLGGDAGEGVEYVFTTRLECRGKPERVEE